MRTSFLTLIAGLSLCLAMPVSAAVRITEWMYNPAPTSSGYEYVELTNLGPGPVDMTGWSFDDVSGLPDLFSISGFGSVAAGESVIVTEGTAAQFRTEWSLAPSVKVVGGSNQNMGRSDGIHIFDAADVLVDKLIYNDEGSGDVKGPRTQGKGGIPMSPASLGVNKAVLWKLTFLGDGYGTFASAHNDLGNPGIYIATPEPASAVLASVALFGMGCVRRRARGR